MFPFSRQMLMIKKIFFLFCLQLLYSAGFSQYKIESIPDPKSRGQHYFVSDPEGFLAPSVVDSLNVICAAIDTQSSAEIAIVVVDDFEGNSDFDFAYKLFNTWGIGKAANNNGLLLFVAINRRKYQFITGYGMEGTLPDVTLGTIGEKYLLPPFKAGDYGLGIMNAMSAIRSILQDPEAIKTLKIEKTNHSFWVRHRNDLLTTAVWLIIFITAYAWIAQVIKKMKLKKKSRPAPLITAVGCVFFIAFASIFVIAFLGIRGSQVYSMATLPWIVAFIGSILLFGKYTQGRAAVMHRYKDEENIVNKLSEYNRQAMLPMLLTPLTFLFLIGYNKRKQALQKRLVPPDDSGKWKRLNRDQLRRISDYLDAGQLKEEKIKSVSYEIWQHVDSAAIQLVEWAGRKAKKYEDCPKCKYQTLNQVYVKTLKAATYSSSGTGEKIQDCNNCDYQQSLGTVILPKKVKSSSSGGSGSSSRSSGGGSWGGGSSGGGGAGGSW
ncbi:TPM domain-containing protein [Niabella insulamsoli]|uniref:TPM domain-containing protein n=1 Tax=Niabella insulamsoli TaxID=3144874 RepID=UPI0031FBAE01